MLLLKICSCSIKYFFFNSTTLNFNIINCNFDKQLTQNKQFLEQKLCHSIWKKNVAIKILRQ
jgi:hypothetical protein